MPGHVILSHGLDSSPQATKVSALAAVAQSMGWSGERPDYADCDALGLAGCVAPRVARLLECMRQATAPVVLVGSSMGAYVSALASAQAPCTGLFLLALPPAIPGQMPLDPRAGVPTMLVHGHDDSVCPASATIHFAHQRGLPLLLLADGHRLARNVTVVANQFRLFLEHLSP